MRRIHSLVKIYNTLSFHSQKPPFIYKDFNSKGETVYSGYCVDLIRDMARLMRFEYELYEPPDGEYGTLNEKLEWTGVMRELVEGVS